jgi:NAD(P)-dependent dehydrogenase (short-subunit alcohol dehydrogenase family)
MTTYAATKAGIAMIAEGIRSDLIGRKGLDIAVTTLYPGYIASEMNAQVEQSSPFMVDTHRGCVQLVKKIEAEVVDAAVPSWPWAPLGQVMKHAPLSVVRRMV